MKTTLPAFFLSVALAAATAAAIPDEPAFSPASGVYPDGGESVTVTITAPEGCLVYYTTDGSRPACTNADGELEWSGTAQEYTGPVTLSNGRETGTDATSLIMSGAYEQDAYDPWYAPAEAPRTIPVLRAVALDETTMEVSHVSSASYLLGDMATRYGTTPVVSVSTEWSDLWATNSEEGYGIYRYPLATNKSKVKNAYVEFFEDGERQFARWIELRIQGTSTLARPKKSLRLTAWKEYNPVKGKKSPFQYKFFPDKDCTNFTCVVLRMGGNDWNQGLLRDMLSQGINKHGIVDVQYGNACIVFLNGVYWGINEIRERWEPGYFKYQHGLEEEEFTLLEYGDGNQYPQVDCGLGEDDDPCSETNRPYVDFQGILDEISGTYGDDLSSDEAYAWFTNRVNPDSVIQHFGATLFAGNGDWPQNNQRFWRAWDNGIDPAADPLRDGRWNWTFHDCDFSFTLPFDYVKDYATGTFAAFDPYTFLYYDESVGTVGTFFEDCARVFKAPAGSNETFRNRYLAFVYFSLATAWRHDITSAVLQQDADLFREAGMDENGLRWRQPQTAADWERNIADIDRWLAARPEAFGWQTRRRFGLGPLRDLVLDLEGDGAVEAGTLLLDDDGSTPGVSFPLDVPVPSDVAVTLTAKPATGASFVGWYETTANLPAAEAEPTASDCAANYADASYPADSLGTGWGAWSVEAEGDYAGTWRGESQYAPIHLRSEDGTSFGLYANGEGTVAVTRELADGGELAVSETMSADVGFGVSGEAGAGLAFVTASGATRPVELVLARGGGEGEGYRLTLDGTAYTLDNFPHVVGMPIRVSLTRETENDYVLRLVRGGETYAAAVALPSPVTGLSFFKKAYGDSADWWNLWFDRLRVAPDTFSDGAELLAREMGETLFFEDGNDFASWTEDHDTSSGAAGAWQNTEKLCNIGLPSFGLWANSGATAKLRRRFGFALSTNYVLSIDFQNNAFSESGSCAGVNFLVSGGESFTFLAAEGETNYVCYVDGTRIDTGVPVRSTGLRLAATVVDDNTISLDVGGTVLELAANAKINGLEVFNYSCGAGNVCNVFFNRVWVTGPAGTVPSEEEGESVSEAGTLAFYAEGWNLDAVWQLETNETASAGLFFDEAFESADGLWTNALGMWANNGGAAEATFDLANTAGFAAASGVVVRFSFQNGEISEEDGIVGWEWTVTNRLGRKGWETNGIGGVHLAAGAAAYVWTNSLGASETMAAATTGAQHVRVAFASETNASVSFLGTTQEVVFAEAPTGLRVFNRSAGSGASCNVFVNHLAVWTGVEVSGGGEESGGGGEESGGEEDDGTVFEADGTDIDNWECTGLNDGISGYGHEASALFDGADAIYFYANSSATADGVRTLPEEVSFDEGWTFSFDFAHGTLTESESSVGWALLSAEDVEILHSAVGPYDDTYSIECNDGSAAINPTLESASVEGGTRHSVTLSFATPTNFTVSVDGAGEWTVESLSGPVRRLRLWNTNAGSGSENNLWVGNIRATRPVSESTAAKAVRPAAVSASATETLLTTDPVLVVTASNAVSLVARFTAATGSVYEAWAAAQGVEPWGTNAATGVAYAEEYLLATNGLAALQGASGGTYTLAVGDTDGIAVGVEVNDALENAAGWREPADGELVETAAGSGVYAVSPTNEAGSLFIRLKLSPAE